ncbi:MULTISPECIES: hypothetical protein [unclassified Sphingomonas]|uniref:hypothetical protein n=1 Tax=unclassified Sphingomonas TaxID=196159 RepID=UPI000B297263|nr:MULTISPECIES: hypothetical protein [unclassified Sphingomonas]
MRAAASERWLAIGVPAIVGGATLAAALMLLPGQLEVRHAERRAHPQLSGASVAVPPPAVPLSVIPADRPPPLPQIAAQIRTADAATLAALTKQLIDAGERVTTLQVAYDLAAAGRGPVALAFLAARPDGDSAESWPLRMDLLAKTGRRAEAAALLARTVATPGGVPAPAIVAAAYALDRPDLLVTAAARGAIPRPDPALTLDLVRRLAAKGQYDLIATLDRVGSDWRRGDPWTAIRVAQARGDRDGALAAAALLPAEQVEAAREAILTQAGDTAGLRRQLLARAEGPGADLPTLAERLIALGARDDAATLLKRAAAQGGTDTAPARRLLYLLGPRPGEGDLAWLRQRATSGSAEEQRQWLTAYAERDRPATALAFLGRHPLADRTETLLTQLTLANAVGDGAAGRGLLARLLDGRALSVEQLRGVSAATPRRVDPAQAAALARARIAAGIAAPRDRMDLAWSAWNGGDAPRTIALLRDQLDDAPGDVVALRLMADAQAKAHGASAARPWLERALAATPENGRDRAELLDRLGRTREAVAMVERLRAADPGDRALANLQTRLLIARGEPGRARAVPAP